MRKDVKPMDKMKAENQFDFCSKKIVTHEEAFVHLKIPTPCWESAFFIQRKVNLHSMYYR